MGFDFSVFGDGKLDERFVEWLIEEQWVGMNSHFGRLWDYYQNQSYPAAVGGGGSFSERSGNFVQAQEMGLPSRITGNVYATGGGSEAFSSSVQQRKEVVIENDISWRVNAMVDFLFGKGVNIVSKQPDAEKRREIESILKAVFAANGDVGFFQDMAVLGSIYGFVDCVLRPGQEVLQFKQRADRGNSGSYAKSATLPNSSLESILQAASCVGLELIEAPRALPVLDEDDYRTIDHYVQHFYKQKNAVSGQGGFISRLLTGKSSSTSRDTVAVTEVLGADAWQRYENGELIAEGENRLGEIPVVHIQNIAQPYYYEGLSDVEQMISLQDELNTRLSDRASRITFQSFKMYLVKGIEGLEERNVSPGRMWSTDNPDASIEQFGGDSATPSEESHITEIREALDKVSGVTPVVAGVLKNKIGNLTSGVAIKMTFMGMLSKTERKQFIYGQGIKDICRKTLKLLDECGVYHTEPHERQVDVLFPSPLPENMLEKLKEAQIKKEVGVSKELILRELGYE
ncbi:MAG: phage portal protein [Planctomycetes bacterium]|nr:phage portal protein [Planctomycetota bacterium]